MSVNFRLLLLCWSLIALPAGTLVAYAATKAWIVGLVGLPLLLTAAFSLVCVFAPRTTNLLLVSSTIACVGALLSVIGFAALALAAYLFGYVVLLLPAIGSGGPDGPSDILNTFLVFLMPGGIATSIFLLFPLFCFPMIRRV